MKTYKEICNILEKKELRKFYHKDLICTPISLIEEIVSKLPEQLFRNKDSKFFDPAMGRGAFLFVIKNKLMENGFSEQYVVENMLFGCDIYKENVGFARSILGGSNKYKCNLLTGDTLEMSKEIGSDGLGKLFGGMKFDCVVGNPPYQEGVETNKHENQKKARTGRLYEKFFFKIFKSATNYAIILPSGFFGKPGKLKDSILSDVGVNYLVDTTKHFSIALNTCAIIKTNTNSEIVTCINGPINILLPRKDFTTFDALNFSETLNKLKGESLDVLWQNNQMLNRSMDIFEENGRYKVISIVGKKEDKLPQFLFTNDVRVLDQVFVDSYKVVMNYNSSLQSIGVTKIVEPGSYVTGNIIFFPTESLENALILEKYLNSNLVKFLSKTLRSSIVNSKAFFKYIPLVDLTRTWTDEELYQHFSLTQEEINLIENTIK